MSKIRIKFDGSFLNRFPPRILHGDIVNIYIVYEITSDYKDINYPEMIRIKKENMEKIDIIICLKKRSKN